MENLFFGSPIVCPPEENANFPNRCFLDFSACLENGRCRCCDRIEFPSKRFVQGVAPLSGFHVGRHQRAAEGTLATYATLA